MVITAPFSVRGPCAPSTAKEVNHGTCAMTRYSADCSSTSSDASSTALATPTHSSTGIDANPEIQNGDGEEEPDLSKSRPASFESIDSMALLTPDLAQSGTIPLPDISPVAGSSLDVEERSTSPNSIKTLQAPGEITPRAHTPKVPAVSTLSTLSVDMYGYNAAIPTPYPSPVVMPKISNPSTVLAHQPSTGVIIYDCTESISMPRSPSTSRCSSQASDVSSSSGSSRGGTGPIEVPPAWAQASGTCTPVDGTYEKLMENRSEVVQEFGDVMFQYRDDEGAQSAVKSVKGRVVVKSDPKRFISVFWLPGLSLDNIMLHSTSNCLNIQANSHERDEHFYWKILLPGANLDYTCASMVGDSLRISVIKYSSSELIMRRRRTELGLRWTDDDVEPVLREATDAKGGLRTEKEMFAP